jgi:hypothetical protein
LLLKFTALLEVGVVGILCTVSFSTVDVLRVFDSRVSGLLAFAVPDYVSLPTLTPLP